MNNTKNKDETKTFKRNNNKSQRKRKQSLNDEKKKKHKTIKANERLRQPQHFVHYNAENYYINNDNNTNNK